MIRFTIPGNPVPWRRPRANGRRHFTPQDVLDAEAKVKAHALNARVRPLAGPVRIDLWFYRDSRRRCDWDNLSKLVCDALNGTAWGDDDQITDANIHKRYDKERPRTEVEITEAA